MAKSQDRIEFQIGYSVDKAGLEQMQSMFQQIANKAQEPGKKITDGLKKAGETAATLDKILEKTFNSDLGTLNVTKFNQELAKSNLTLKDVKNNLVAEGNLGATAYNKLTQAILGTNQQLRESNKLLDSMAKSFKNVLTWGVASSVFNSVTASIQNAYVYAKQLNSSLNDIRIVTDKSAESMEKFAIQANNAAKNLGASTLDYSNAALIYYQQGLSDEEAQARAETTVKAANITGQTGEAVSEQLTAVWNGYKVTAEETELYVDKLAAVAATTAADLEELSVGMSKVASAASTMGVDFDDLNAQMATIVSVTRQAPESVGTALKTIYARLGDLKVDGVDEFGVKLGEVTSNLKTMGIEILDEQGNMRDMTSVMTEVAEKWNTWTEAQKQAAAIAMAGKRQYNNLMALFENWDMYSKALETSADAMGTLQHQQDIYMESTSAKLKTLKATWQDLYDGLIDDDEINAGIDALTNLVQVFDNFIDSFGGGIKSIAGFGAIVANIFSKQISNGITNVIQQATTLSNNLDLARTKAEAFSLGSQQSKNASPVDLGAQANTQDQLKTAQEIYAVRQGINEEQAQTLINDQKIKGELVEQKTILEEKIKRTEKDKFTQEELEKYLKMDLGNLEETVTIKEDELEKTKAILKAQKEIAEQGDKAAKKQQEAVNEITKIANGNQLVHNKKKNILKATEDLNKEQKKQLETILEEVKTEEDFKNVKSKILEITKGTTEEEVAAYEKQLNSIRKILGVKQETYDIDQQIKNKEIEIKEILEQAAAGANITKVVTSVTSSLSTMAMAWSSVNSLMQTFEDENASISDKITQAMMTLGMTIPMVISSITKLNEAFGFTEGIMTTFKAIQLKNAAATALSTADLGLETKALKKKSNEELEDLVVLKLINEERKKNGQSILTNVTALTAEEKATKLAANAQREEVVQLLELKTANDSLNASMLASPVTIALVAVTALAAGYSYLSKKEEELVKAQLEENKAIVERIDKSQEELKATLELYESFKDLYEQYEKGEVGKEALYDITDRLCEIYQSENTYLAKLTGNYEILNEELDNYVIGQLKAAEVLAKNKKDTETENLLPTAIEKTPNIANRGKGKGVAILGNTLGNQETYSGSGIDSEIFSALKAKFSDGQISNGRGSTSQFTLNIDTGEDLLEYYKTLEEEIKKLEKEYTKEQLEASQGYKDAVKTLESLKDDVDKIENEDTEDIKEIQSQEVYYSAHLQNIKNIEEYRDKIAEVKEQLNTIYNGDEKRVYATLDSFADRSNNRFVQLERGLEKLHENGQITAEDLEKFENWSEKDKEVLFSGKIDLQDPKITEEEARRQVDHINSELAAEDLSIVVSLRTKVTSDKKLGKKDIQEMEGEEANLSQDYETYLNDFDNESQLDQVEILNEIVEEKIKADNRYLEHLKKQREEEKAIREQNIKDYKNKAVELQEKIKFLESAKNTNRWFDEGLQKRYDELNKELKETQNTIVELQDEVNVLDEELANGGVGLTEEFNNRIFEDMIAAIDGVISKAEILSDVTSKIGENWVIAGKDIEDFAMTFPELLANQENFNYLQDGSIQITEQGKVAFQEMAAAQKEQLLAENEAYQLELQRQADIHKANADYHKKRIEHLKAFLNGEISAVDTQANLEQDLADYKLDLSRAIGQDDAELTKQMQENINNTTNKVITDCDKQWEAWCSVGNTALQATLVGETGTFQPPKAPSGLTFPARGVNVSNDATASEGTEDWLSTVDRALIEKQIAEEEKIYEEEYNKWREDVTKMNSANARTALAVSSFDNAGKGKNKSSKSNNKDKDYLKPAIEYWHEYKQAIEDTDRALKQLEKEKEHLRGGNLVKALSKENKLLEKQRKHYADLRNALLAGPEKDKNGNVGIINNKKSEKENSNIKELDSMAKEKYVLKKAGAKFDKKNNISNYAALQMQLRDEYNAAIDANKEGKLSDIALEKAKIYYDEMTKIMKSYTDHVKEINDLQEKEEEARLKEIANNLKKLETKIQLKHDKQELKRDILEYQKESSKDIQAAYEDYSVEVDYQVNIGKTYEKDLKADEKLIAKIKGDIDKFEKEGVGDYYASIDEAQAALIEAQKTQIEHAKALQQSYQDAWDAYLDGIDQAIEQHEVLYKEFDRIDDELEHQGQLIELVYGEEAYDLKDQLYESQHQSSLNRMASLKNDAKTYKDLLDQSFKESGHSLDNMLDWNEDEKKYYEQWREAQAGIREEVEKDIQTLKDKYDNAIKSTLRDLEKQLTGGRLEDVESEWERITKQADKYYDDVEKSYEIQTLANKMDKEIASTKDLKTQQKLKKIRDEEIKMLREKDKLTSYDIKKAELRYQLELKQMALEDARNNKTSMKLTRNAEGNWSYQYVAEEEDVKDKEQDYLDTWHELYELSSDAYNNNLEEQIELYKDFMSDLQDLAEKKNQGYFGQGEEADKKYYEALKQREQQYLDDSAALAKENAQYIDDLKIHSAGLTKTIYDQDVTAFKGMTEEQQRLVTELKNNCVTSYSEIGSAIDTNLGGIGTKVQKVVEDAQPLESLAQNMIDLWNGDDGESVKSATDAATDALVGADNSYITGLQDIEKKSGEVFYGKDGESGMINSMESLAKKTKNVRRKLLNLNSTMEEKMPDMEKRVNRLKKKWEEANSSIQDNIDSLQTYLDMLNNIETPKKIEIVTEYSYIDTSGAKGGSSGSGSTGSGIADLGSNGDNTNKEKLKAKRYASEKYAIVEDDPYGVAGTKKIGLNSEYVKKLQNYISDPNLDSGQKARYEAELKEFKEDYKTQTKLKEELANINKIGDRTEREKRIRALLNKYGNTNIIFDNDNLDEWAKSKGYDAFATGGYTGTWGNDGRLALLHQKELVLNAEDTENLLSGISMIRDMSSLNGSINNSILKAISNMMLSLSGINTGLIGGATTDNSSSNTTFNITAEFPNAENVNDIREAILSLPNLASQFKGQRLK